jgi:hypothetical protein
MSFWKKLMGRRDEAALQHAEDEQFDSPAEREVAEKGVGGLSADQVVDMRFGGTDPIKFVDDQFKP